MKISIITLGCPKNEVDSEILASLLKEKNFEIIPNIEDSDIVIINTCAFIKEAVEEAIDVILNVAQTKKRIIVAGCLVSRYGEEKLKELLPEVEKFFNTYNYINILKYIRNKPFKNFKKFIYSSKLKRFFDSISKYVKISEGCSNACSYCIIPKIKGKYFSRPMNDILEEIKKLTDNGVEEIILVSQDTGRYGIDLKDGTNLEKLIEKILNINSLKWLKVLYLYPDTITDELLELTKHEKFCSYLDIPIQHVDDKILKLMNRKISEKDLKNLFYKIKNDYSHLFLRTTVMVGFPQEDENAFKNLLNFIKDIEFYNLGCFKYSKEEGTLASKLQGQISQKEKNKRFKKILKIQKEIVNKINRSLKNKELETLIEGYCPESNLLLCGRTFFQAPDIDGKVYINKGFVDKPGIYKVKIKNFKNYDLIGELT